MAAIFDIDPQALKEFNDQFDGLTAPSEARGISRKDKVKNRASHTWKQTVDTVGRVYHSSSRGVKRVLTRRNITSAGLVFINVASIIGAGLVSYLVTLWLMSISPILAWAFVAFLWFTFLSTLFTLR